MKIFEFRLKFHKFIPKGQINNIPALVQIMVWHLTSWVKKKSLNFPTDLLRGFIEDKSALNVVKGCHRLCNQTLSELLITEIYDDISPLSDINTLRPRQNGRYFTDSIIKCIFLNENISISIKISLKFAPKGPINNVPALVQIMAWRRPGDKPLSKTMMVKLPTHVCITLSQWVDTTLSNKAFSGQVPDVAL